MGMYGPCLPLRKSKTHILKGAGIVPSINEFTERIGGCIIHMELCKIKLLELMGSSVIGVPGFHVSGEIRPHLWKAVCAQQDLSSAVNDLRVFTETLKSWYDTLAS